jgi:cytidylate kinase
MTASDVERAVRRTKEVLDMNYDQVAADIARRDHIDSNRAADPLTVPGGAAMLDTTGLSVDEVVDRVLDLVKQTPGGHGQR